MSVLPIPSPCSDSTWKPPIKPQWKRNATNCWLFSVPEKKYFIQNILLSKIKRQLPNKAFFIGRISFPAVFLSHLKNRFPPVFLFYKNPLPLLKKNSGIVIPDLFVESGKPRISNCCQQECPLPSVGNLLSEGNKLLNSLYFRLQIRTFTLL